MNKTIALTVLASPDRHTDRFYAVLDVGMNRTCFKVLCFDAALPLSPGVAPSITAVYGSYAAAWEAHMQKDDCVRECLTLGYDLSDPVAPSLTSLRHWLHHLDDEDAHSVTTPAVAQRQPIRVAPRAVAFC